MPAGYYQEFMPKFTGVEGISAEEHLESFYSYADNLDIYEEDVWMRVFVQSLDGDARNWLRQIPPRSIAHIEALDDVFLRHWGNNSVINKGEESSPSSFVSLYAQMTSPYGCPLSPEAVYNLMSKAEIDHLSLNILMLA